MRNRHSRILIALVGFLLYTFRVLREYERGVVFIWRFYKVKGSWLGDYHSGDPADGEG